MPRKLTVIGLLALLLAFGATGVQAGDTVLSNNTGTASTIWFISGEASLILNGFDLNARGINLPVQVDKISISVRTPQPGAPVEVVVYQDADGGSPLNATLLKRQTVDITTAGVFTVTFDQPVTVNQPFLWVGFYLPVDFEFRADTSGPSVLTYWGWRPHATFDLSSLANAAVFGPSDGSAPVNINMGGVARITAEIITDGQTITQTLSTTGGIRQIVGDPNTDLSVMVAYPTCNSVKYDSGDLLVTYRDGIDLYCRAISRDYLPEDPPGFNRRGMVFDLYVFGIEGGLVPYPYPITHCVQPSEGQLDRAVLGLAQGAPHQWRILPTVRFGSWICAEMEFSGLVSVFVPR